VSSKIARGLRRIADVLQRGLFDADEERLPEIEVRPRPTSCATRAPTASSRSTAGASPSC
jgi:hypothetical protein